MSDEHRDRTTRIFLRAAELEGDDRARFLDDACAGDAALRAEVESLLRADLPSEVLTRSVHEDVAVPSSIGPYRLLDKLGEGGMGVVYLAEQTEPVRRRVALKLVKVGMDTKAVVARFEAERQALALMDHPHVARVLDAGATVDGRPYFVMEHVQGLPITEHCDRHRLTTRERLELFLRVCDGVQHAHQKALIHRDLKPSNVLVTIQDGRAIPKIIDFGVAKATAQRLTEHTLYTALGVMIGTPEYMSPEQADLTAQDVDTRTDVYALGVMLYELLTGALPFEPRELRRGGFDELRRRIREDDPPKPSTRLATLEGPRAVEAARARRTEARRLNHQLRGDLDWIVMKALEKDRGRRYASPSDMAADVRRHLRNEAVEAGPPSGFYRVRKFVRRHRLAVGVSLAVVATLAAVAVRERVQARRIAAERDRANLEAATSARVTDFLLDVFSVADAGGITGESVTARELLDRGAEKLDRDLEDEPLLQARLTATMAEAYSRLGFQPQSEALHRRALGLRERILGPDHPDTLRSREAVASCLRDQGRFAEAIPLYETVLEARGESLPEDDPELLHVRHELAVVYSRKGDRPQAEAMYRRILEARARALGESHVDTLVTLNALGWLLIEDGRLDEAEPLLRRAVTGLERSKGPRHALTFQSKRNLAYLYGLQGRDEDARPLMREFLEECRERARAPGDAAVRFQCALRLLNCRPEDLRDPAEALRLILEAAEMTRYEQPQVLNILALAHFRNGNAQEAVRVMRLALEKLSPEDTERREAWEGKLREFEAGLASSSPVR